MQMDIVWLLKSGRYLTSKRLFLETLLAAAQKANPTYDDIIDQITFKREECADSTAQDAGQSRTEYAALNLDALYKAELRSHDELIRTLQGRLARIEHFLRIREAILMALTTEERILVEKHYDEGISLLAIADKPLVEGGYSKSQSTLKRMLKGIHQKAERVVSGVWCPCERNLPPNA